MAPQQSGAFLLTLKSMRKKKVGVVSSGRTEKSGVKSDSEESEEDQGSGKYYKKND